MKLVKITWRDAMTNVDWMHPDVAREIVVPIEMETVGFLLADEDDHYKIVHSRATDGTAVGSVTAIPKAWTDKVMELTRGGASQNCTNWFCV